LHTPWHFSFEIFCSAKQCIVVDLQIDSTDKEDVESEPEVQVQEEHTLDIYTTESSTEQVKKVNEGTTLAIFCTEEEETENQPEVAFISGFNSPIWHGYHYKFQITQEEFGFLVFYIGTKFKLTKKTWTFGFIKTKIITRDTHGTCYQPRSFYL
jgi:hypothetical protein